MFGLVHCHGLELGLWAEPWLSEHYSDIFSRQSRFIIRPAASTM